MASVHREKRNGKYRYRVQFHDKDNRRRSIRLGNVDRKASEAIRAKLEDLISASIAGSSPHNETAHWLRTIGDDLAAKLTAAGFGEFIPRRESATLDQFLRSFIESRKAESAASTITNFEQVRRRLVAHFGPGHNLRLITAGDADDWRQSLVDDYAEATLSKLVKRARQVFRYAVRKGYVDVNPFAELNDYRLEAGRFGDFVSFGLKSSAHDGVTWKLSPPSPGSMPFWWRMYSMITSSVTLPLDATK